MAAYLAGLIAWAALFILSFFLILLVCFLVSHALDLAFRLPILSAVNTAGGALLGLVKGALLLFFAVWLLRRLQLWITPELISQTYILRFFAEHSPMELITSL